MGGQPGKPKPIGNPPIRYEPQRRPPMEEPPRPIPPPPVERPPLPAAVLPASKNSTPFLPTAGWAGAAAVFARHHFRGRCGFEAGRVADGATTLGS
jgi:hypothetical protein